MLNTLMTVNSKVTVLGVCKVTFSRFRVNYEESLTTFSFSSRNYSTIRNALNFSMTYVSTIRDISCCQVLFRQKIRISRFVVVFPVRSKRILTFRCFNWVLQNADKWDQINLKRSKVGRNVSRSVAIYSTNDVGCNL